MTINLSFCTYVHTTVYSIWHSLIIFNGSLALAHSLHVLLKLLLLLTQLMVARSDPLGMQLGLLPHLHQSLYSPPLPLLPQELSLRMQCGLMGGANMYEIKQQL